MVSAMKASADAHLDIESVQIGVREILEIIGHDHGRLGLQGCGDDMGVARIRKVLASG